MDVEEKLLIFWKYEERMCGSEISFYESEPQLTEREIALLLDFFNQPIESPIYIKNKWLATSLNGHEFINRENGDRNCVHRYSKRCNACFFSHFMMVYREFILLRI